MRKWLFDRWPATFMALRFRRRFARWYAGLLLGGVAVQASSIVITARCVSVAGGSPSPPASYATAVWLLLYVPYIVPLYIAAWVVPAAVGASVARVRTTGRWEALAVSRASHADLWLSTTLAPMLPCLIAAEAVCWPYWLEAVRGANPIHRGPSMLFVFAHSSTEALAYAVGVAMSAAAFGHLAVLSGFRARSTHQAIIRTFTVVVGLCYAGSVLSLGSLAIGSRPLMPAVHFTLAAMPAAFLAPNWMLGATIYTIPSRFVGDWIVWITTGVFALLALVLSTASFLGVCRARRPQN